MPRFEKWLTTATANAPADAVARAALAERVMAVRFFLSRSTRGPDEAESIHQLRVWSRRASAALDLFKPALPASRRKRLKKLLRKLRRAAGAVRDCDIHLQRQENPDSAIPKRIVRTLKRQRWQARRRLKQIRRHLERDGRLEKRIERLLEKIGWPKRHSSREAPPFGHYCRQQLEPLASEFFRLAQANLDDNATLHALRIAGKRLRYALELAPAVLPERRHRQLYDDLNEAQGRLGEVCDQLAAIEHLHACREQASKKSHRRQLQGLLAREDGKLTRLRSRFLRWWSKFHPQLNRAWKKASE